MNESSRLLKGDCRKLIRTITDNSVDLIIVDPPYGKTDISWDKKAFQFDSNLWSEIWRVLKLNAPILIWGIESFSSKVRISQEKFYRYDWYWNKSNPTGHLNAKKQPLRNVENISVFYRKQCAYFPQLIRKEPHLIRTVNRGKKPEIYKSGKHSQAAARTIPVEYGYPRQLLKYDSVCGDKEKHHPTEKPVELLEYLIKTYTQENDLVLDFVMGCGGVGVAAKRNNRKFIGIEINEDYFQTAKKRLEDRHGH